MKRIVSILTAAFLGVSAAFAQSYEPEISDIRIGVMLDRDGTAYITESWNAVAASGTEWYLVRNNLGDIGIGDLSVSDENGTEFINEGSWDVNRSLGEKAGRCGLHKTSEGYEICWGVGSYGPHEWTVNYKMTNAAKSLEDYDILHMQFVGDHLSSPPKNVHLTLKVMGEKVDTTNARIWGFGYNGTCEFENGYVVMQSDGAFSANSSLILLLRLDKGIIEPTSVKDCDFETVWNKAKKGSSFDSDGGSKGGFWSTLWDILLIIVVGIVAILGQAAWVLVVLPFLWIANAVKRRKMLGGKKIRNIPWSREIPFGGDILASHHVLRELGRGSENSNVASAYILRMIQAGALTVRKDMENEGKVEIVFEDETKIGDWDTAAKELWSMMIEASGEDKVLQYTEFGFWSKEHKKRVANWVNKMKAEGKRNYEKVAIFNKLQTPQGQAETVKMLGLKKFLTEFTLIGERTSGEAVLWQDYLVFAALLGIADKVAKELQDINPKAFTEITHYDPVTMQGVLHLSNNLARAITSAKASYDASQSRSSSSGGYGGRSSYGGGGGFSGGGHGGGSR